MTATPGRVLGTAALTAAVLLGVGPASPPAPALPAAGDPPDVTVTVHGRSGSFGSLGSTVPSGHSLARRAVPEWGLPPGTQAGATAVAADGTVFVAGRDRSAGTGPPTAAAVSIGAYQPATGEYTVIQVPTSTGRYEVTGTGRRPLAPSVTHLAPVAGGTAIGFTVGASHPDHDPAADGAWPVLGVLTKVDGVWQLAGGDGWSNQWTGGQLRASHPPVSEPACPEQPGAPGHSDCRGLGELISLPGSGHLIATQAGEPGWYNGSLVALRLAGPDRAGRFQLAVTGFYLYPNVTDPASGESLDLQLQGLQADPTGGPEPERFAVSLHHLNDPEVARPAVIQEFRYDAAGGEITPVSAPTIPGDQAGEDGPYFGYAATVYDRDGNLWATRHQHLAGGKLGIHLGGLACRYDPARPPGSYQTGAGGRAVWGQTCRPDVDLLQPQELVLTGQLLRHPATGEVVVLGLLGGLLPVRPSGSGEATTFQVGNLVDTGLRLLPAGALVRHYPGAFDASGRLWLPAGQAADPADAADPPDDHWLYEVDVAELFDPVPVPLPEVPGQLTTVQAGHTVTTGTLPVTGAWATTDVNSEAYLRACTEGTASVGCSHDGLPGDGFRLGHRSGFGHLGGEVGYRVEVPAAGRYRVAYRVLTLEQTTDAEILLTAGGRSYPAPVSTAGRWLTVPVSEPVALPAGIQTIRLSSAEGRGGWYLSWFSLQRSG